MPKCNPKLEDEKRIREILSQLTPDQKRQLDIKLASFGMYFHSSEPILQELFQLLNITYGW